jgi:hypothetical protein
MRSPALPLIAALLTLPLPLAAQEFALQLPPHARSTPVLRNSYHIRLVSNWPQLTLAGTDCVNGGAETLSGEITRDGAGRYHGTLQREATISFCGAHASARVGCALTLTARGPVAAWGDPIGLVSAPELDLHWSADSQSTDLVISGNCPSDFEASLRRLYLAAAHAAELPLPTTPAESGVIPLTDYGWLAEIW